MLSHIATTLSFSKELAASHSLIHTPCDKVRPAKITPKLLEVFNMEKLDLSFKKPELPYTSYWHEIKTFPRALCMLDKLTEINMSNNNIEKIPKEFGQLINLVSLYLDKNKIRQISEEIGNLSKLENLDLSDNYLVTLPKEIINLSKLRVLNLSGNPFWHIPDEIFEMDHLKLSLY
jgi:Leucine-rich repeat (LRR) protein